ncbi:hypothetical protein ABZZ17_32460 [Streptomyces sp. NPDC006512]|uniref:hypothetical protein n=1 Tax=Streptomyces sp. NPDC006512 TaxID=3154307 RepID=UPI0033B2DE4D
MGTRTLRFDLYADTDGLAWVGELVDREAASRRARVTARTVVRARPDGGPADDGHDGLLAEQWAVENPGLSSGGRESVGLRVRLDCSLRTYRAVRKAVIRGLCPEGTAPHTCRVPWSAW